MIDKVFLQDLLDESYNKYNSCEFISDDPVSIPHQYNRKEDIEISAFITATIAWGQRKTILQNGNRLMSFMDNAPFDFVMQHSNTDLVKFKKFVHRTFNGEDCIHFIKALKIIYTKHGGVEKLIISNVKEDDKNLINGIVEIRRIFFSIKHESRTQKHFANPLANSSSKRLNMYLRWMIRKDNRGVDFGLWDISPSLLLCPLDVHSGRVGRELGLLKRRQDDLKAVIELTNSLKEFDKEDPVKYDFALFGLGVDRKAGQLLGKL